MQSPVFLVLVWVVVAVGVFLFDLWVPLGVAAGVPYVGLVLLGVWSPWRHAIIVLATVATVLTVLGYVLSPPGGIPWMVLTNRGLALFAIWVTALLLLRLDRNERALRRAHDELEARVVERTAELSSANAELARRVDAHKTAEAALRASEDHLRGIMNNMVDGIVTIDEHGTIESFSAAAERIFGYTADEVRGRDVTLLMPEPDRGRHGGYVREYLRTGRGKIIGRGPREMTALRKDGSTFPAELAVSEMRVGGRRVFIGAVRDITQRKATEAQLQHALKMEAVGQLTGGVAHDFNNLLTVIIGNLQLLARSLPDSERLRSRIRTAEHAALRGAELTKRLLAFSRRQVLEPKDLNLNQLVAGMCNLLHRTLGERIKIETVLAAGLWPTRADPGQLESALLNLALNARDAMPDGGKLTIETANTRLDDAYAARHVEVTPGQYVMLAVTDTGTGIPPDVMEHAFDPFFTTKEVGKGSGLGLSMVFGFVKQSGGHIKIYSEVGEGTTVKIYLPRARAVSEEERAERVEVLDEFPAGEETILVVEDDPDVRETAVALLEDLGYRVLTAENGPAALAVLDQHEDVNLLFTDVVMPGGMDGVALAKEVQNRRPHIKVLYTSGYAEDALVHNGKLANSLGWIGKPYSKAALARKVRDVLGGSGQ